MLKRLTLALVILILVIPSALSLFVTACGPTANTGNSAPQKSADSPEGKIDWKSDWEHTLAAAKKEGKVVVAGGTGDIYRPAAWAFQKVYPEIQVEFTGIAGSEFAPRVLAEREAGQFLWDVHQSGTTTMLTVLKPKGVLQPLRPALILPEVLDDSKWMGGFDDIWMDKDKAYIVSIQGQLTYVFYVNRDIVPESELSSIDQLLEPEWKGRIVTSDPRVAGSASGHFAQLLLARGEEWVRDLLAQDLVIQKDERQVVESVILGRSAVAIGASTTQIQSFRQAGATARLEALEPDGPGGAYPSTGFGAVSLVDRAPHPNAAKAYVNWLLSTEGQKAWVEATKLNSRRLDVVGPEEGRPKPGVKYYDSSKEELAPMRARVTEIAKEVLK